MTLPPAVEVWPGSDRLQVNVSPRGERRRWLLCTATAYTVRPPIGQSCKVEIEVLCRPPHSNRTFTLTGHVRADEHDADPDRLVLRHPDLREKP